jgi:hypothetical protein
MYFFVWMWYDGKSVSSQLIYVRDSTRARYIYIGLFLLANIYGDTRLDIIISENGPSHSRYWLV